ncbi:hypothetical protein [Methanoregula sp.]|uniref:hypothetical protein n=1 Tax=Methanoregula sp. TaxID=2052170 RepID=UPI003C4843E3
MLDTGRLHFLQHFVYTTLTLSAVPLLNKDYSARFVRTMCTGDRQCEIKIEKKPPAEKKEEKVGGKT